MKPGENCSSGFREEDIEIIHNFIHVYSPGARADNKGDLAVKRSKVNL